jgi:hypothetical protein
VSKRRRNNSGVNSGKQRGRVDNLKAHQYKPGQSGNRKGRPPVKGLLLALKAAVAETLKDGRTIEQAVADELIRQALKGRRRLQAIAELFDRLEGKARQQVDLNDITKQLQGRSDAELLYFAEHGTWPDKVGNA